MKTLRCVKTKFISKVFSAAHTNGMMTDWAAGSDSYNRYVLGVAKLLTKRIRTNPSELVKVSACLVGYAYDNYGELNGSFRELDLALDVIKSMSEILESTK
jgi:effector-binding domain-containing protein